MDQYNGILPVHKETGMTSHDVIDRIRDLTGVRKVGHTGTLDPMASGLLPVSLGRATKLTQFLTGWDKRYRAEITLGAVSDTLDADGAISPCRPVPEDLSVADVEALLARYVGRLVQQVPAYSAVKVDGRKLYSYARGGVDVVTPSREVEIKSLELDAFAPPCLTITVHCSKGTYIRTLAGDIGRDLGCGGYLSALKRLSVGPFEIKSALTLKEIEARHAAGDLAQAVMPIERVLDFPVLRMRNQARDIIRHGGVPPAGDIIECRGDFCAGEFISMADELGEIMAIGRSTCDASQLPTQERGEYFSYVRVLI